MATQPTRDDKFSFGLWTFGWQATDPFGGPTRSPVDTEHAVHKLAELGAYGMTFHDDDLFAFGSTDAARQKEIDRLKKALAETGLIIPMVTTNLFSHPVFKDGGFTSNDREVRRFALRKVLRNIDLAAELGAETFVMWGGREGSEYDAAKDIRGALERYREAVNLLGDYVDREGLRPALRDRAEAQRAARRHPAADRRARAGVHRRRSSAPSSWGSTPRSATSRWPGSTSPTASRRRSTRASCSTSTSTASAASSTTRTWCSVTATCRTRSRSSTCSSTAARTVASRYEGPRHFDYKPSRTEDWDGVWESVSANMRMYLLLKERATGVPRRSRGAGGTRRIARAGDRRADPERRRELRRPDRRPLRIRGLRRRRVLRRQGLRLRAPAAARARAPHAARAASVAGRGRRLLHPVLQGRGGGCRDRCGGALGPQPTSGRHRGRPGRLVGCPAGRRSQRPAASTTWPRSPSRGSSTAWWCWMRRVTSSGTPCSGTTRVRPAPLTSSWPSSPTSCGARGRGRSHPSRRRSCAGCATPSRRTRRGSQPSRSPTTGSPGACAASDRATPPSPKLVTDRSDASGTSYWGADGYDFGVLSAALGHEAAVPRVLGPNEWVPWGELRAGAGAGDNAGAALGLGAESGDVVVSIGTSGTVFAVTDEPTHDESGTVAGFADASGRLAAAGRDPERRARARCGRRAPGCRPRRTRPAGARGGVRARTASCCSPTSRASARPTSPTRPRPCSA